MPPTIIIPGRKPHICCVPTGPNTVCGREFYDPDLLAKHVPECVALHGDAVVERSPRHSERAKELYEGGDTEYRRWVYEHGRTG